MKHFQAKVKRLCVQKPTDVSFGNVEPRTWIHYQDQQVSPRKRAVVLTELQGPRGLVASFQSRVNGRREGWKSLAPTHAPEGITEWQVGRLADVDPHMRQEILALDNSQCIFCPHLQESLGAIWGY